MAGGIASSTGQGTASPALTIALVGIAITCGQGDLSTSEQNVRALTGQAIVASQGSVSTDRHGLAAEVLQGAFGKSFTVPLSGTAIAASAGTVTPNADDSVPLSGQVSAVGQGTLVAAKSEALTGSAITSAQQTIAPTLRPTDIVGQAVVSGQGAVSASADDVNVHLSGHEASFEQGSVVVGGQQIAGLASTPAAGTATPDTTVALTGSASTCAQGSLTAAQEASEDTHIISAHGSVVSAREVALTGLEALCEQGVVGVTGDVSIPLTGEAFSALSGSLAADFGPALSGQAVSGAQYFVGAPGGAALTGAEAAVVAGTIHITNDREYAISGVEAVLAQGALVPEISFELVGQTQGTGIGDFLAQPDRKALTGQSMVSGQGFMHPPGGFGRGAAFGFSRRHHPRHPHVPKDILEVYYEQEEVKRQELKRVVKKAEKLVSTDKVLAAREAAESPLPADPSVDDTAQVIAAILKRAKDSDLAAIKSPLTQAEIDARNDEDLVAAIL